MKKYQRGFIINPYSYGGGGPPPAVDSGDPYFYRLGFLLHCDGADASVPTTDQLGQTITAFGNAQVDTSQSVFGGGALLFDGVTDSARITLNRRLDLKGDWTFECRFRMTGSLASRILLCLDGLGGTHSGHYFGVLADGAIYARLAKDSNPFSTEGPTTAAATVALNTWYAVRYVKVGLLLMIFVNGDLAASHTLSEQPEPQLTPSYAHVGSYYNAIDNIWNGWIDELRWTQFSRGVSNYDLDTQAFPDVVASSVDPFYDQVSCYLPFDGTDASTTLTDLVGKSFTAHGNAQLDTSLAKFGSASLLLDGTGDYASCPHSTDFSIQSGDFTVEAWLYRAVSGVSHYICSKRPSAAVNNGWEFRINSNNTLQFFFTGGSSITGSTVPSGQWVHVAAVRYGNTVTLYIDGANAGSGTFANGTENTTDTLKIGVDNLLGSGFNGHIDSFRITKGAARYLGNFSPIASAPVYARGNDPFFTRVLSQLPLTGANGGTTFTDLIERTWTPNGNAQTSTAQSAGGGSSTLLDGTGDFLNTPSHPSLALGTGDFTVEWYQRWDSVKQICPIDFRGGTASSPRLMVYNNTSSTDLKLYVSGADRISAPSGTLVTGTWQHIAICRSGGITRLFVDGTQRGSNYTDSTNYTAADWRIGRNTLTTERDFNGYMQAFRATAAARYTGTFTPPTPPLPITS